MLHIVIVDDSREDLGFLERVLRQCKILNPIHSIHSGEECLAFFRSKATRSLVILDLVMAPTSGISVIRELRESGLARDSVIVMLSGITDIKAINEGYQLGAATFLIKPIKPEDILEMLNGMKSKIRVEEQPTGYLLEWVHAHPGSRPGGEPPSRTFSLSA